MQNIIIEVAKPEGKFVTLSEMVEQFKEKFDEDQFKEDYKLNVSFSGCDPLLNENVDSFLIKIKKYKPLPIFITYFPTNGSNIGIYINCLMNTANEIYDEGFVFGMLIESTSDKERKDIYGHHILSLQEISKMMLKPPHRKNKPIIILNPEKKIDTLKLSNLFNPDDFFVKLKPTQNDISDLKSLLESQGFTLVN